MSANPGVSPEYDWWLNQPSPAEPMAWMNTPAGFVMLYNSLYFLDENMIPPETFEVAPTSLASGMKPRLEAFARDCVANGDMTPTAARMLNRILNGGEKA